MTCECIKFTMVENEQHPIMCGNSASKKVTYKDIRLWCCDSCKIHNQFMYNANYSFLGELFDDLDQN